MAKKVTITSPRQLPVTVVVTVLNEQTTVEALITGLHNQTVSVPEIIIVDGGSTDDTVQLVTNCWQRLQARRPVPTVLTVVTKHGNRSVGRNAGIERAKTSWLAVTDAGCVPHQDWLEQLWLAAENTFDMPVSTGAYVMAGYYDAEPTTPFAEAIVPYALVMPDRVNPRAFLPATRSVLFTKPAWRLAGKFDERLADNEDYALARRWQQLAAVQLGFTAQAKVTWYPRTTWGQFWTMIFRFARGDAQAGLFRPKVGLIFGRYAALLALMYWCLTRYLFCQLGVWVIVLAGLYSGWAIVKNKRHVPTGWYYLPALQIVADAAVMGGSANGWWRRWRLKTSAA